MAQQLLVPLEMEVLKSQKNLEKVEVVDEIKKLKFSDILKNFEAIIIKAFPSIMVMELSIFTQIVNMYYSKGNRQIVGVGFGTIWLNLMIRGVLLNANLGISLLMNRHFREKNYFKVGICYQRGLLISCIYLIFITPLLGLSDKFFRIIGIDVLVTEPATLYAWEVIPSTWAFSFFDITRNYLQAIGVYYPIIIIQVFSSIIHVVLVQKFMIFWELGIRGAAWASNLSDFLQAILIYLYIVKYQSSNPSWIEWDKATLKSIEVWVKQQIKVGGKYFIQGCSFEIMLFMSIHMTFQQITVSVCLAFTAKALFMLQLGLAQVALNSIQRSVKSMDIDGAKTKSKNFVISSFIVSLLSCCTLIIFQNDWVQIFGLRPEGEELLISLLYIFILTSILDGMQTILVSILNAVGDFSFTLNAQLICHYGVGLVSGVYLGYEMQMGIQGLWIGWSAGLGVTNIILIMRTIKLNWEHTAQEILVVKKN